MKAKDARLNLVLPSDQLEKLKAYADSKDKTMSEILREYINRLPDVRKND